MTFNLVSRPQTILPPLDFLLHITELLFETIFSEMRCFSVILLSQDKCLFMIYNVEEIVMFQL